MKHIELITTNYIESSPKIPAAFDGFRLAVLADLHDNCIGPDNRTLLEALRRERPDVILIAGDLITEEKRGRRRVFLTHAEPLLKELTGLAPVYYGLGNHEKRWQEQHGGAGLTFAGGQKRHGEAGLTFAGWQERIAQWGVTVLDNRSVRLHRGDGVIRITGLSLPLTCYRKLFTPRPEAGLLDALTGKAYEESYQILLAHTPAFADTYDRWGADLALAGHYHGGVVRLPGLGGVLSTSFRLFPRYDKGRFRLTHGSLIVSAGLGSHTIPLRINNPPELVSITLRHTAAKQEEEEIHGNTGV